MGDEQHRSATILPQAQHFVLHPHAGEGVEGAEGFIEQENFGMIDAQDVGRNLSKASVPQAGGYKK
jgi:hypothetical protein